MNPMSQPPYCYACQEPQEKEVELLELVIVVAEVEYTLLIGRKCGTMGNYYLVSKVIRQRTLYFTTIIDANLSSSTGHKPLTKSVI